MKILVCGASGFVGRHLTQDLRKAGHSVIRAVRKPREPDDMAVDFRNDNNQEIWLPRLKGIDVVINAVGLLRDSSSNPMQILHTETPVALFAACAEAGVQRVVHLSALGVDSGVDVPYFSTRLVTEAVLKKMPDSVRWLCLRPSVIYGEDGASAQMFRQMAKLPVQVLPMGGVQTLQPVHIDDICEAVARWLGDANAASQTVAAVGAEATTMRGMLDSYRAQMKRGNAWHFALPSTLVRLIALAGDYIPSSPMCSDPYAMLAAGNTASPSGFAKLLGREPRSFRYFIA
ncbi:MAG: NAD-dependent epimerase/dehydratase family protein [Sideroxydans sp.]|nr:NAD-dependent epimerase/dehydratase family protein [Sideroxydans sp.]